MMDSSPPPQRPVFREAILFASLSFLAAVLTFFTQAVFSRELAPGEFGVLSAALGFVLLLSVPLSAVNQSLVHHLARFDATAKHDEIEQLHLLAFALLRWATVGTGLVAVAILFLFPHLIFPSRPALQGSILITALTLLATTLSGALCAGRHRFRLWGLLVVGAAVLRLILALAFTSHYPRAEMALALTAFSSLVTAVPIYWLRNRQRVDVRARQILAQKDFMVYLAAATSVMSGLFFFSSGDQIMAQFSFAPRFHNVSLGGKSLYDDYQAAGLLGRSLIWGAAPVLAVLFAHLSREPFLPPPASAPLVLMAEETGFHRRKGLQLLLLYFGIFLLGSILLETMRGVLAHLFLGSSASPAVRLIPLFVAAMMPLGMLQAIGIVCLATKSYGDCFALGFGAIVYTVLLRLFGHSPDQMLSLMFEAGSAVVLLLALLHVGRRVGRMSAPRWKGSS